MDKAMLSAAGEGRNEEIRRLRARGANVNATDDLGRTPVFRAAIYRRPFFAAAAKISLSLFFPLTFRRLFEGRPAAAIVAVVTVGTRRNHQKKEKKERARGRVAAIHLVQAACLVAAAV